MRTPHKINILLFITIFFTHLCHAAITLNATRVIFIDGKNEATVTVKNPGKDILVQSWLESRTFTTEKVPFAITPSLVRLNAESEQLLRLLYQGKGMPLDRESMMWLNVQEIPQKSDTDNQLQVAIRQKIKVFYRPKGLTGSAAQAPEKLLWQINSTEKKITITNPSAYYVNMVNIKRQHADAAIDKDILMLAPQESASFTFSSTGKMEGSFTFGVINDFGGRDIYAVNSQNNEITKIAHL